MAMTCPLRPTGITRFITTTEQSTQIWRIATFGLAVVATRASSLGITM